MYFSKKKKKKEAKPDPSLPPPIKFQELLQLTQLGINQNAIKFTNITIESDRCIVVREENKISIVNTATRNVTPLNVTVDSAIMNPSTNVIGLRSKNNLQIFNLDMRTRMKTTEASDAVLYWRWLDSRTIAFVTTKAVYHWSMDGDVEPEWKFDIVPEERQVEIIGYDASDDNNWLFFQGIAKSQTDKSIEGVLQLYNVPLHRYQPKMNAHGGCFAHLNINGRDATLFCFTKKDGMSTKIFVVEVGNQDNPLRVTAEINFQQQNDFIVAMVPAVKYGCIYAISQKGTLFLYDIQTGRHVFSRRISNSTIFSAIPHDKTGGVITLDRSGKVALIHVDPTNYVPYITNHVDAKLGATIAKKYNLPILKQNKKTKEKTQKKHVEKKESDDLLHFLFDTDDKSHHPAPKPLPTKQYSQQIQSLKNEITSSKQQSTKDKEQIARLKREKEETEQTLNELLNNRTTSINNQQLSTLKSENERLKREKQASEKMVNDLVNNEKKIMNEINELKNANSSNHDNDEKYSQQISSLKSENESLKQQIVRLKRAEQEQDKTINGLRNKTKIIENENNEFRKQNANLNEECKELKLELNEIKNKYDKLYRMHNIDTKNFRNWNYDNIADWIMSLSEDYQIYENALRAKLKEEQLEGADLGDLNKNDLDRFGIKAFKHKKSIMIEIKQLIGQNANNNDNNNNNNYANNIMQNEGNKETVYL